MRLLFDTSTLIAALVEAHTAHDIAYPWLRSVKDGRHIGLLGAHSLAELYSNLTHIPFASGPLTSTKVRQIIETDIEPVFEIVALSSDDYLSIVKHLAQQNLVGGIIFDALIFYAAIKADADQLLTLNPKHFRQIYPEFSRLVIEA
ncbi:PIN domain-containing protein [soil metagenome]